MSFVILPLRTALPIGRSGFACTKADVLAQLPMEAGHADIVAGGFELRRLGEAVALLTYRSAHRRGPACVHLGKIGTARAHAVPSGTPAASLDPGLAPLSEF